MHLLEHRSVGVKAVHDAGKIAVHGTEYGHAKTEIGTPEQSLALLRAHPLHLLAMVGNPSRTAAHHLHAVPEGLHVVVVGSMRCGKLYGHIGTLECIAIKILLVVNVDNAHYLVSTTQGYLLYHTAHLAVSYQRYFHICNVFFIGQNYD